MHEEIDSKRLRFVQGQTSVHSIVVTEDFSFLTFHHTLMLFYSNSKLSLKYSETKCYLHPNSPSVALL